MKFWKDPDVINIFKFSILFLLVAIGLYLIPQVAYTIRDAKYIENEILPLREDNFDEYLEKIASYYEFYYKKDPIIDRKIINTNDIYFEFSVYAVSYYQPNNKGDVLQFFIHDAKYKNQDFKTLQANILYDKPIVENKNPDKNIVYLDTNTIRDNSFVKSFFVADLKNEEDDKNLNYFKSIELMISLDGKNEEKFLVFTDDDIIASQFPLSLSIEENNLTLENYSLSNNIKDKKNNLPTEEEIKIYNLYFQKFNSNIIKSYNWIIWGFVVSYIVFMIIILFFMFLYKPLKLKYKNKKPN